VIEITRSIAGSNREVRTDTDVEMSADLIFPRRNLEKQDRKLNDIGSIWVCHRVRCGTKLVDYKSRSGDSRKDRDDKAVRYSG